MLIVDWHVFRVSDLLFNALDYREWFQRELLDALDTGGSCHWIPEKRKIVV